MAAQGKHSPICVAICMLMLLAYANGERGNEKEERVRNTEDRMKQETEGEQDTEGLPTANVIWQPKGPRGGKRETRKEEMKKAAGGTEREKDLNETGDGAGAGRMPSAGGKQGLEGKESNKGGEGGREREVTGNTDRQGRGEGREKEKEWKLAKQNWGRRCGELVSIGFETPRGVGARRLQALQRADGDGQMHEQRSR